MKRMISFILMIIFVISFGSSSAYALGKPELKFRDVKFGITYKEAMPLLQESGLKEVETENREEEFCYEITFSEVEVADYKMTPVAYFRYKDKNNSKIEDSIFTSADYKYNVDVEKGRDYTLEILPGVYQPMNTSKDKLRNIRDDLEEKLSSLYGKSEFDNSEAVILGINFYMENFTWSNFKGGSKVILWSNLTSASIYDKDKLSFRIEYVNDKQQKILDKMVEDSKPAPNNSGL